MAKVNVYFIVDLGALAGRLVVAMTESKQVYDEGERSYGIDLHPTSPKETFYLTHAVETAPQQGPVEYNHQIVHLSGKVTKVFLRPGNTMESQLPRR